MVNGMVSCWAWTQTAAAFGSSDLRNNDPTVVFGLSVLDRLHSVFSITNWLRENSWALNGEGVILFRITVDCARLSTTARAASTA